MNADYGDISLLSMKHLELIKWISDDNKSEKKLSIVESIAPKWEKLSAIFNLRSESIKNPGSGTTPEQCLRQVLRKWQEKGDEHYPFNWSGLLQLLKDIDHGILAKQLEEALASQQSTVRSNLHHLNQMKVSKDTNEGSWTIVKIFGIILIFAIVIVGVFFFTHHFDWNLVQQYRIAYSSKSLPFISDNFVGREDELEELLAKLNFKFTETRIVSILGSPGFGKSTLAIKLGHKLVEQEVDVHYANLDGAISENIDTFIAEKILESASVITKKATFKRLLQWGRERSGDTLLILDNCDSVFNSDISMAGFVNGIGDLILSSKSIKIITTSRKMFVLHLHHNYHYKVYQLSTKAAISLLNNKLPETSLEQKFKEQIAEYTGNVPLALHIIGSLLTLENSPSPKTVIKELKSNAVQFLSPEYFPTQLRVDASISLSYQYLDKNLKKVALHLSLFSGSFSKDAPIAISAQLQNVEKSTVRVSITQNHLRALVDRSLLEYKKREDRYQYHRLIREFLRTKLSLKKPSTKNFLKERNTYFLKQLHLHTIGFDRKYVDSLKFLDSERHNIYKVLIVLSIPKAIPRKLLLMTVDYVTKAIDVMYLTCRFTNNVLHSFLFPTLVYLDIHVLGFQERCGLKTITDLSGTTWTQKEYYQRIYIQLVITFSDLIAKSNGQESSVNVMETRKTIVDLLSRDNSNKKAMSDDKSYSTGNSHQEQIYAHPTKFSPRDEADPSQDPDTVPLATRAQKRLFYSKLSSHYLALGNHSKVIEYQLKIMDEITKCKQGNCSYQEIGYIYLNINNYAEAAHFLELSLQYEKNNVFTEMKILLTLFDLYKNIKWPWMSENESNTLNRIMSICPEIRKQEDKSIFHNWKLILEVILFLNKIERDDFLEERLYSILSTPNAKFQLKPNDALSVIRNIEQIKNKTKILQWGSFLLKPFENYDNFSTEETITILQIKLSISKAHLNLNISGGLDGMESIYERLLKLQDHNNDTHEMHSTVCIYLVFRLKYISPCYKDFLKKSVTGFAQTKLWFTVFFLPVRFRSAMFSNPSPTSTTNEQNFQTQSTAVVLEKSTLNALGITNQAEAIVEPFVMAFHDKVVLLISDIWNKYTSELAYFWCFIENMDIFIRFSTNVITVYIRLKLAVSLILATLAAFSALLFLFLEPLYMKLIANFSVPRSFHNFLIAVFKILFYLRIPIYLVSTLLLVYEYIKAILLQTISFAFSYELIRNELHLMYQLLLEWCVLVLFVQMFTEFKFSIKVQIIFKILFKKYFVPISLLIIFCIYLAYI